MNLRELIYRRKFCRKSYSQCGEDLIIDYCFFQLGMNNIVYLDLGANHPIRLNNTYYFYKKKCRGCLVEADLTLCDLLKKIRPDDKCVNVGVGPVKSNAKFYIMSVNTLNTFSKDEAEKIEKLGEYKIVRTVDVEIVTVNEIIEKYLGNTPDLISLDVEGMDFEILKSIDLKKYRPKVFVVETIEYSEDRSGKKVQEIINYMLKMGYIIYADTYINTIFVDSSVWNHQ